MSDQRPSSSLHGDANTATPPTTRWAPHGRALMACLIVANVSLVVLVYLYFWRLFSRKRPAPPDGDEHEDDGASSSASTPPRAVTRRDVVASLPVFVHSGAAEKGGAAECAVCIAELRDGDECRALPRCGHRFHAACVDTWLRLHTTCPLCRASATAPPAAAAEEEAGADVPDTAAAVEAV